MRDPQVQEELRKRHLFFRDIDGRPSLEYAIALKRYQARQGSPSPAWPMR